MVLRYFTVACLAVCFVSSSSSAGGVGYVLIGAAAAEDEKY